MIYLLVNGPKQTVGVYMKSRKVHGLIQVFEYAVERQHGYLYKEQMRALFKSMKRWWCSEIKVSQQEYDQVCAEALEEFEEFQSSARWKIFTARKP